jgi:hypothetical protein
VLLYFQSALIQTAESSGAAETESSGAAEDENLVRAP